MTKSRLLTALLALALALAMTPAVLADSHESSFDPSTVDEWDQDEALILYSMLEERLLAMGVAEEDMDEAVAYVGEQLSGMSEEDVEDLAELMAAQGMADELMTEEEGENVDLGDGEFMQSDEEEPEIDIDLGDEDEEDDSE